MKSLLRSVRTAFAAGFMALPLVLVTLTPTAAPCAPTIVAVIPANASMGVSPAAPVIISFSAAMNTNLTTAQFINAAAPGVPLSTATAWNASQTALTCTPTPAFPALASIVWNVQGRDLGGSSLSGNTGGFFMTGSGGPYIVSVVPAPLSTNVSPSTTVVFTFSTAMNTNFTSAQFHDSTKPGVVLPVTAAWSVGQTTLTYTPNPPFPEGKTILWNAVGEDASGTMLQGASGTFNTAVAEITLVSVVPPDGSAGVSLNAPVVFTFSTAMNPNLTTAEFYDNAAPLTSLSVAASWSADQAQLTCAPAPSFPTGATIRWRVSGAGVLGGILSTNTGSFITTNSILVPPAAPGVVSRGELAEQMSPSLFQSVGPEFVALASGTLTSGVRVTLPAAIGIATLERTGWPDMIETRDAVPSEFEFATNYPPGIYLVTVGSGTNSAFAALNLTDGSLPSPPRIVNWQSIPYVVLGQSYPLTWEFAPGGTTVDHVQLRVEQDDGLVFATPLDGLAGALTGASNSIVVPAAAFTKTGRARLSLTGFSFTGIDTNSIPGVTVRTARHRTTTFELRVVDGATPPPTLRAANLVGIPVQEPFLFPIFATNGVKPLRYEVLDGTLPPGLALRSDGWLSGTTTTDGPFNARLRLTDLLGHSTTQSLAIVATPLPAGSLPRLENMRAETGSDIVLDVLAAPGAPCDLERSTNLSNWAVLLTTNITATRTTLRIPTDPTPAFFRARTPGTPLATPRPLTVTPVLDTNTTASAELDVLGGTLSLTNAQGYVFSLNVPPGALTRAEFITMTRLSRIDGLPLSGGMRAAVDLQPEGLIFDVPARLDITVPTGLDPKLWMSFGARTGGSEFALQPSFITNRTVSLYLWHFTSFGSGEGTAGDAAAQANNAPSDPMQTLNQDAAAAIAACKADPDCLNDPSSLTEKLTRILLQMADQVVIPELQRAVGDETALDQALSDYLNWLRELELLGLYDTSRPGDGGSAEIGQRVVRALNLAVMGLANGINKACQDCLNHDLSRLSRMVKLAREAALLGLGEYAEHVGSCADRCLRFELAVESEIISWDAAAPQRIYTAHTKAKVKLRLMEGADVLLQGLYTGSGQWDITKVEQQDDSKCEMSASPASGRMVIPLVTLSLFKERLVWVPGQGAVKSYTYAPDVQVYMKAGLQGMPSEGRQEKCPETDPVAVADILGPAFNVFHMDEVVNPQPGSVQEQVLNGSAFRITGFTPNSGDIITSKSYSRRHDGKAVLTEETLIDFRHTPGK